MTDSLTCPRCGVAYAPEHRFCGACGAELRSLPSTTPAQEPPASRQSPANASDELNRLAGIPYDVNAGAARPAAGARDDALPYYIPPNRIVLLTVLSAGLYLYYWMYVTWRHYQDHTGELAYPVWHALTLLVPVYNLFRIHAHMRVYQEMMDARGVPTTLNPLRAALIYLGVFLLALVPLFLPVEAPITPTRQAAYVTLNILQVALLAWMLWQAQGNINRFWQHRLGTRLVWKTPSLGELLIVALGFIVGWGMLALALVIMIDPTFLQVEALASPTSTPSP